MKKLIVFVFLCSFGFIIKAQPNIDNILTKEGIQKHLKFLASDEFEGRESGYIGQKKAAEYIAKEFLNFGLLSKNNAENFEKYYQSFNMYGRKKIDYSIRFDSTTFFYKNAPKEKKPNSIVVLLRPKSLENGTSLLYFGKNYSIKNKINYIHLINNNTFEELNKIDSTHYLFIPSKSLQDGLQILEKIFTKSNNKTFLIAIPNKEYKKYSKAYVGEWLLEIPVGNEPKYTHFNMFGSFSPSSLSNSNVIIEEFLKKHKDIQLIVTSEYYTKKLFDQKLNKLIKSKKSFTKKVEINADFENDLSNIPTENVLGYIEGSEFKNEVIVIGAHFDHVGIDELGICYGADDNASGTAAVIEIAKTFYELSKQGIKPKRSILFIAFSAEEKGLYGSKFYTYNPWFEHKNTVAMLNMDMIGRFNKKNKSKNYSYVVGFGDDKRDLKRTSKKINKKTQKLSIDSHPGVIGKLMFRFGSDHFNFNKKEVSTLMFSSGFKQPDYHTPRDTYDKIDFVNTTYITKLVFYTAWELANQIDD